MTIEEDQRGLAKLTIDELRAIRNDFHNPEDICKAAGALEDFLLKQAARESYLAFQAGTDEFVRLTSELLGIARNVPAEPVATLATKINELIVNSGDLALRTVGVAFDAERGKTDDPPHPPAGAAPAPQPPPVAAPVDGPATVLDSRDFQTLKAEYVDLFDRARISADHLPEVVKVCGILVANKPLYQAAGDPLGVPWHVVAVIHAMESLNFGRHLHNGDPLEHRTVHDPQGRPKSGSEPFTWPQSAADALKGRNLDQVGGANWTLARTLYELEGYNGFGYRQFRKATPYLWSYCQHYDKGRYVADRKYDPAAPSRQCGAAVLLKNLEGNGAIRIPR